MIGHENMRDNTVACYYFDYFIDFITQKMCLLCILC